MQARVASIGKDAESIIADNRSVTNGNERRDSMSARNMSAIKGSGTPGAPRQLNVLSNFKYEYFVAGISGGVVSTLMLHPLDLIKIRFAGESRARVAISGKWRLSHCDPAQRPARGAYESRAAALIHSYRRMLSTG